MLDNTSRYIYEVYKSKSVSQAAKKLFLSQPALSASIKKAENELGFEIFNRKTIPFTLTPEGRVYIDAIEKIISLKNETEIRISALKNMENGTLRIAIANPLCHFALPKICSLFLKQHPNIDINIEVLKADKISEMLKKDLLDFGFTSTQIKEPNLSSLPLMDENYVVALKKDGNIPKELMPYALSFEDVINRQYSSEKLIRDISLFDGIEFVYTPPSTNIFCKRKIVLGDPDIFTNITSSSLVTQLCFNLASEGFGAFFGTDAMIASMQKNNNCLFFVIDNMKFKQSFNVVYTSKKRHSIPIIDDFISAAQKVFDVKNPLTVFRQDNN